MTQADAYFQAFGDQMQDITILMKAATNLEEINSLYREGRQLISSTFRLMYARN